MARQVPMQYKDAVRLLGAGDSALVSALDQALGLGLLAMTAFSPVSALPFFEVKNELIAQLQKLVSEVKERARKSGRLEYEQLLTAAHAVIVMAAYAEVLAEQVKKLDGGDQLQRELHQWKPRSGAKRVPGKYHRWQFVEWADQSMIRPPGPTRPLEKVITDLRETYQNLSTQALDYLEGLRSWDELLDKQRQQARETLMGELPRLAIMRYREHFIRLALQIPEFMIWNFLNEGAATRSMIRGLIDSSKSETREAAVELGKTLDRIEAKMDAERAALGDLPSILMEMVKRPTSSRQSVAQAVTECHRINQFVLEKPMLEPRLSGELEMIRFPSSIDGYINPDYRITETQRSDEGLLLASEDFWQEQSKRSGLAGFLAGYIRTECATEQPLLVLGDPGSGKSLLSKILAARLPPNEFAVVRVELRHVRFSQEISDQIDLELQRQTKNRYHLRDLTDERGRITRVVIMDGLDELLQLSRHEGLGRYLEWLADFQEFEAALGHPVIAIATARTIVMDRIYVPSRTTVIRLEEFNHSQIISWLKAWNRQNAKYFAIHKLQKLDSETLMRQFHLARQPLLLALLALYDAEKNALRDAVNLSQAQLYERIFHRYLERELEKADLPVRQSEQEQLIEQRFRELSTIAIGMLNRGRHFITRQEVIEDFHTTGVGRESSSHSELTSVDDAVGQFFFLYRAQALHEEAALSEGYEFIHATFEEFLAARIIAKQLARASEVVENAPVWDRLEEEKHARSLLTPYLARRPLAGEEQVLLYLQDIVGSLVGARGKAALAIASQIPALLRIGIPEEGSHGPDRGQLDRLATLTVNLVAASLRTANATLPLRAFCEESQDPLVQWRRMTMLWQAYLAIDDWDRVLSSFVLSDPPELELSSRDAHDQSRGNLEAFISEPHILRMIQTGWLTADHHLRAAASVWSWVLTALVPDDETGPASVESLSASALFRLSSGNTIQKIVEQEIEKLKTSSQDILKLVVGGPLSWPNKTLDQVASYLIQIGEATNDIGALLEVIRELDKRDNVPLARKLLSIMPADAVAQPIPPADVAAIIALSRRHQIPELLSRCPSSDWITSSVMNWLTVEDITWIIQSRSIAPEALERLHAQVRGDVRYRRVVDQAIRLLAAELSVALAASPSRYKSSRVRAYPDSHRHRAPPPNGMWVTW